MVGHVEQGAVEGVAGVPWLRSAGMIIYLHLPGPLDARWATLELAQAREGWEDWESCRVGTNHVTARASWAAAAPV